MKYRIVSNGKSFRIQQKFQFWPFWPYIVVYHRDRGIQMEILEWATRVAADAWIEDQINNNFFKKAPWKPI